MITDVTPAVSSGGGEPRTAKKELGKEDFLNLLVTQMQYQDPLKPMENSEFTAQLAQFSSLDQLYSLNEGMAALAGSQETLGETQAVGYIGKEIQAAGDWISVGADGPTRLGYTLDQDVSEVRIRIYDQTGGTLRVLEEGERPAGQYQVSWDGRDDHGDQVPPGEYRFDVTASDNKGEEVIPLRTIEGTVQGVAFEEGGPFLRMGNLLVPLDTVMEVRDLE